MGSVLLAAMHLGIPDTYVPKKLAGELQNRRRLPVAECVQMGLQLTSALGFLHQHHLIHRDIKPANIIYVSGAPKIADIGLVTEMGGQGKEVTYIGTEGYIAPEGPGTPAADVYSLGKVLYEISMGRDRHDFPALPTSLVERADDLGLMALNRIICKACELKPEERYQDANAMGLDLLTVPLEIKRGSGLDPDPS